MLGSQVYPLTIYAAVHCLSLRLRHQRARKSIFIDYSHHHLLFYCP